MTRVPVPSLDQLDRLGDDYASLVALALADAAQRPESQAASPADLAPLRTVWGEWVDGTLLPALGVAFEVGAAQVRVGLREAVGSAVAAGGSGAVLVEPSGQFGTHGGNSILTAAFTVAPTSDALAEQYLAQARNRLVGVGDELWAHAREGLLEGLQAGESVPELAARVRKAAPDLTEPRATVIARTEVLGAVNAGALEQVLASGATGTKQWIAADDERTRHSHDLADNDTVGLREHFTVGGFPMQRPHDPAGPPQETISCRCALSFDLDLESEDPAGLPTGPSDSPGEAPTELHGPDVTTRQRQERDRSFLARVFGDGLAALVGWFKARTAAATLPADEHAFEGADVTAAATEPTVATSSQDGAWEGVLVVEGTPTGDGRQFSSGALTWAELPLPLKWQEREAEGHSGAVIVGRIDSIEREGDRLVGRGVFDLDGAHGQEAHRLVSGGYMRGVSIQPDDISDSDVELLFAEGVDDEGDPFARPELVVFNAGRVRSATLCAEAAFVEAEVRLTGQPLLAAASLDDYRPPADWFANPGLSEATGIVVEESGEVAGFDWQRVYGHAATFDSCHIGFGEVGCVSPPFEADHPYFLTGEVVTADGSRVPVGQITLATGHAPLSYGAQRAAEHYDDTGSVVADVTCGNDEHGIWVAGAVRPGTDPGRIHELRASGQLSGDWRRIGGQLRLVALLAVNVPGFPVPRPRARVASGSAQALVAAGKVEHGAGQDRPDLSKVKLRIAASIKRDSRSRREAVAARVKARG